MAKFTKLINNFTAGELSPYLYGRSELKSYLAGAKQIENFIVLPYGGLLRRPGFKFVAEVKDSTKKVRLIPFEFSTEQTYILEFGHQYIRFYMDNGQIQSGGLPYEIATPYDENDLFEIQYAQNADVMWIVHPEYKPKKLTRYGHTNWILQDYIPTSNPFQTPSWQASTTYSAGDKVEPTTPNGYYYKCITAGTSDIAEPTWPTTIGQTVNDGTCVWRCEGTTPADYPSCVTFYEQRLWFAATRDEPQAIWATKSGDFEDMTIGVNDDDALKYVLGSDQVNAIKWLSAGKVLAIGTIGGIFVMGSNSATTPITPTNVMVRRETNIGTAYVMPKRIGTYAYYVQRDKKHLRQFAYNFDSDSYLSLDMTLLAEHIAKNQIKELAYQASPYSILWAIREDGMLLSFTRNILQQISAWAKHTTDGLFESVAVIPRQDGAYDEVWVVVQRTINNVAKRYIEYLTDFEFTQQDDAFYVDSGLTYDGAQTTTISGLDHLEGKTVKILADGAVQPDKTVQNGQINLDIPASKVQVGLGYESILETLKSEGGSAFGTAQGKIQRIYKIGLNLYRTLGGFVGYGNTLDELWYRDSSMPMDQAVPLFDGFKFITPPKGYDRELTITVKQIQPLPICIRALILFMVTFDE